MALKFCSLIDFSSCIAMPLVAGVLTVLTPTNGYTTQFMEVAQLVLDSSPEIQIAKKDVEIAAAGKERVRSGYLPQLVLRLESGWAVEDYQDDRKDYADMATTLSLSQELFDIPTLYKIRAAESMQKRALAYFVQLEQDILLELAVNWCDYWRTLRQYEIGEQDIEILQAYLEGVQARFDGGDLTITDVRLAQVRLQASKARLLRYSREIVSSRESIRKTIGGQPPADVTLVALQETDMVFPDLDAALEQHPFLQPLTHEFEALKMELSSQKAGHYPTIKAVARYKYQTNGEYDLQRYPYTEGYAGLTLNLDLYTGGYITHSTEEALGKKIRQGFSIVEFKRELTRKIQTAKSNFEQSGEEVDIAEKRLEYARQTLEGMIVEFDTGTRTSVDVFLSQADMITAQLEVVAAQEQYVRFIFDYLHALGMLSLDTLQSNKRS